MVKLNKKQIEVLKTHSDHHSKKHMNFMKNLMQKGESFTSAHKKAMNKVGK